MNRTASTVFKVAFILLAISLAVLVISPLAYPVSDAYLSVFGIISFILIAVSAVSWFIGRK